MIMPGDSLIWSSQFGSNVPVHGPIPPPMHIGVDAGANQRTLWTLRSWTSRPTPAKYVHSGSQYAHTRAPTLLHMVYLSTVTYAHCLTLGTTCRTDQARHLTSTYPVLFKSSAALLDYWCWFSPVFQVCGAITLRITNPTSHQSAVVL